MGVVGGITVVVSGDDRRGVADALLRAEVARRAGVDAVGVVVGRRCARCGSRDHGRPVTDAGLGLGLSVSRARGVTVVAVSDAGPVGVDVETPGAADFAGFDEVALHPDERRDGDDRPLDDHDRTRVWVRTEALLKAAGEGLRTDPRTVRSTPGTPLLPGHPHAWVRDLDLPPYVGAVAGLSGPLPVISVRVVPEDVCGAASP